MTDSQPYAVCPGSQAFHRRVKEVFSEVIEATSTTRASLLNRLCEGNTQLRNEVDSLLAHARTTPRTHDESGQVHIEPAKTAQKPTPPLVGTTIDGRYAVESLIDEGGFSHVYRARHTLWNRPVAIKVFKSMGAPDEQGKLRRAFIREGALLHQLSQETTSIVQALDVGTVAYGHGGGERVFMAMEWLEGETLSRRLRRERKAGSSPWSPEQLQTALQPIAEALRVAHANGIAHRDIKPANLFMATRSDGSTAAKLLDFGVAKVASEYGRGFQSTGESVAACTMSYAAPEQIAKRFGPTGPWTDVYAFALICVELLVGGHPMKENSALEFVRRLSHPDERPTPRRCGLELGERLERVFQRALARDVAARTPDVGQFWGEYTAALRDADSICSASSSCKKYMRLGLSTRDRLWLCAVAGGLATGVVLEALLGS